MDIASVRILRMAVATGICMFVSQIVNWPLSFIAPVFTMFILALPMPAPKFSGGVKFALVFIVSIYAGLALLPLIIHYRVAGLKASNYRVWAYAAGCFRSSAAVVAIAERDQLNGVDFFLAAGHSFSGSVDDARTGRQTRRSS